MRRLTLSTLLLTLILTSPSVYADKKKEEKVNGYLEFRRGVVLIIDGQRVQAAAQTKFKGKGLAKSVDLIPLGYECKAEGYRQSDGIILAEKIEAKPNGNAMFESEVRDGTNQLEAEYRRRGMMVQPDGQGGLTSLGDLHESGPQVTRVRRIMSSLVPEYLNPEDMRVYVIDNPEWNAMAMGNYSFYVFDGLLQEMNDDEVAIILAHELVHASHEHSRRQAKRDMWIGLASAGAAVAAGEIDDDGNRELVALAAGLTASAFQHGYGRSMEDQADRVGLRYAYEAGYDISKGPELWYRFARKYGNGDAVTNFFFSDHSLSLKRAKMLEQEIALNYQEEQKTVNHRRQRTGSSRKNVPLREGMTFDEVYDIEGTPEKETTWGSDTIWSYPDKTVIFSNGRLKKVRLEKGVSP